MQNVAHHVMQMKMKMKIKIKRLHPEAVLPKAREGDAGLDFVATSKVEEDNYTEYGTGIALEIPENHVGLMFPRSSVSRYDLVLCNSVGVIDATFRGEVKFRFRRTKQIWTNDFPLSYNVGDKIGQLIIMPYPSVEFEEVEELTTTERNEGGFGSTDIPNFT